MAQMSQAIRMTIERYAPTLKDLDGAVLDEFSQIVWAFHADLQDEQTRRLLLEKKP